MILFTLELLYNSFEDTTPIAQKQNDELYYIMTDQMGMPNMIASLI